MVMLLLVGPEAAHARGGTSRANDYCRPWERHGNHPVYKAIHDGCRLRDAGIITTMMGLFFIIPSGPGLAIVQGSPGCARGGCPVRRDLAIAGLAVGGAGVLAGVTIMAVGQLRMNAGLRLLRELPLQPAPAPPGSWGGGLRCEF
jgi:hypothetical protein